MLCSAFVTFARLSTISTINPGVMIGLIGKKQLPGFALL
jgi:hypothetical protein